MSDHQLRRCAGLLCLLAAAAAPAAEIRRTDSGSVVDGASAENSLAASSLALKLEAGEAISLYGLDLKADSLTLLFASSSSEYLMIADLSGRSRVANLLLGPGDAAVLNLSSGKLRRHQFDAARLAASASPALAEEINSALRPVIASQARKKWWGYYQPVVRNAQLPAPPALEAIRRDYLLQPEVIRLRKDAAGDRSKLNDLSAERFVAALARGDDAAVSALIDPVPFADAGSAWASARRSYAGSLIASDLPAKMAGASVSPSKDPGFYEIRSPSGSWTLSTINRDDVAFIDSMTSIQ
jgi:hypothetical protein